MPNDNTPEVIVVGAGHAGLSISYFLQQQNISHIVFERGTIGYSWRTQRWDSFCLNTPNWMNALPGDKVEGEPIDGFMQRDAFVNYLEGYAKKFKLPVQENTKVISAKKRQEDGLFEVTTDKKGKLSFFTCRHLVIACGIMSAPKMPAFCSLLPKNIHQLHGADYRNADSLPEGAVLVTGGGQSGCQIAEDLANHNRKVYFATSRVGRYPRRYRGRDILEWATENKFFDAPLESITDPKMLRMPNPHISGTGRYGHTLSLQSLARQGVSILGRLVEIKGDELVFANDAAENVRFADEFSAWFKKMIDDFINASQAACEPPETEPDDMPDNAAACVDPSLSLNIREKNISTVIWTTGYTADFSWITPSVTNENGVPVHDHGISPVDGVYFIGFPWLRTRKSGIVYGMDDDARFIVEKIAGLPQNKDY